MWKRFRTYGLIALLALLCAQGWNRVNIAAMQAHPFARHNVRDGRALLATDDASYLQGADKLLGARPDLEQGNVQGPSLRAPGYGSLYLLLRLALDPMPAISALIWLQCLLFAVAVVLLWETLLRCGIARRIRWPLVLLLAVMPTFHGFLFHTLTEGITPALSLTLLCCALLDASSMRRRWLFAGTAVWCVLMFTRPALLWMGIALLPGLLRLGLARASLHVLLAAAPMLGWWAMNCVRANTSWACIRSTGKARRA